MLTKKQVMKKEELADIYAEKEAFRVPYGGSNDFYDKNHYEISKKAFVAGYEAANKWIDVGDKLPEIEKPVLVLRTNPNVVVSGYIHERGHWVWSDMKGSTHKESDFHKITHWRPIE